MDITNIDRRIIAWFKRIEGPTARIALFIIFFWFGILKLLGASPAEPLVQDLFTRTIPFIPFNTFYVLFSLYECLIGVLFLIPKATRVVIALLVLHMVTTFLPLVLLPSVAWSGWFVPTLEGQYILKNLAIIALAIGIAADITPLEKTER
jgi:uncharacterized membrane protein YphA (DoxX/SURF4 family)